MSKDLQGKRRSFSDEFKRDAVNRIVKQNYLFAAKAVGVGEGSLRRWHRQLAPKPQPAGENASLAELKAENQRHVRGRLPRKNHDGPIGAADHPLTAAASALAQRQDQAGADERRLTAARRALNAAKAVFLRHAVIARQPRGLPIDLGVDGGGRSTAPALGGLRAATAAKTGISRGVHELLRKRLAAVDFQRGVDRVSVPRSINRRAGRLTRS